MYAAILTVCAGGIYLVTLWNSMSAGRVQEIRSFSTT